MLPATIRVGDRILSLVALLAALLTKRGHDLTKDPVVIQLCQEIGRVRVGDDFVPCLLPDGIYYVPCLQKVLSGLDFAALQGLDKSTLCQFGFFDLEEHRLKDFCGNAFSLPVVMCAISEALVDLA